MCLIYWHLLGSQVAKQPIGLCHGTSLSDQPFWKSVALHQLDSQLPSGEPLLLVIKPQDLQRPGYGSQHSLVPVRLCHVPSLKGFLGPTISTRLARLAQVILSLGRRFFTFRSHFLYLHKSHGCDMSAVFVITLSLPSTPGLSGHLEDFISLRGFFHLGGFISSFGDALVSSKGMHGDLFLIALDYFMLVQQTPFLPLLVHLWVYNSYGISYVSRFADPSWATFDPPISIRIFLSFLFPTVFLPPTQVWL